MILKKQFEEHIWKRDETFHQYVHEKIILANRVPISEDEIIDYIIDGILVARKDQSANLRRKLPTTIFEKVTLRDRVPTGGAKKMENGSRATEINDGREM